MDEVVAGLVAPSDFAVKDRTCFEEHSKGSCPWPVPTCNTARTRASSALVTTPSGFGSGLVSVWQRLKK